MKSNILLKPLGGKAYGSIPHLPGSKHTDVSDRGLDEKGAKWFTDYSSNKDYWYLLEKLDGSSVCVADIGGSLIPLTRSGYSAKTSRYEQHQIFHKWVNENILKFNHLMDGHKINGEWLYQAHGTRYDIFERNQLFVAFDYFIDDIRQPYKTLVDYCREFGLCHAPILYEGHSGIDIKMANNLLGEFGKWGARELAEGCVWRWERFGCEKLKKYPIMMAKFVRPQKEVGKYLKSIPEIYNLVI
jgi:hypothetical protein